MHVAVPRSTRTIPVRLLLAVSVVFGVLATEARGASAERAAENTRVGADPRPVRGRDVVTFAVDPADPRHIVALDEDFINSRCMYRVSFDGGETWAEGTLNAPADFEQPACGRFDSGDYAHVDVGGVAFGTGQNVYATFSWNRPGQGDSILVAKSTDGGRNFGTGVVAISGRVEPHGPESDGFIRPKVGVEPRTTGDRVYVSAWGLTTPVASELPVGANVFAASERRIIVTTSSDGAATFSPPIDAQGHPLLDKGREQSIPVAKAGGTAFVAWRTTSAAATTQNLHLVARTTDGGATWQRFTIGNVPGVRSTDPRLALDQGTGTLYVTYWAASGADGQPVATTPTNPQPPTVNGTDAYLQRSTDNGVTWSAPKRLNDDPILTTGTAGIAQRLPEVTVAPDGRVHVVFEDRRNAYPANPLISAGTVHGAARGQEDYYHTFSTDQGLTFSPNHRISDRTINLDFGLDPRVTGGFYPPTVSPMGPDRLITGWGDNREGNYNNETQDVYRTVVDLRAPVAVKTLPGGDMASASVALSRLAYPGGVEMQSSTTQTPVTKVVLVNEQDSASALAGSVLARDAWGPLLTSPASGLPASVRAEAGRLQAVGAYVIGSTAQLPTSVETDLAAGGVPSGAVQRLSGASPAATARLIADILDTRSAAQKTAGAAAFPAAVIVNPASPDAAAAAGLAASRRFPVLFVDQNSVPTATTDALTALAIPKTYVIGGPGAVSNSVLAALPAATRLGGGDQYATSQAVAQESKAQLVPTNVAYVADGNRPVDAAVVGAAAARMGGLLLLSPGADPDTAQTLLGGLLPEVDRLVVQLGLGGYRFVASDGGVFNFGGLPFFGSTGGTVLNSPVVGMANTPSKLGYWLVASDGGIFAFGDAVFRGSTGGTPLNRPIVGMERTVSGNGYWLVASDGGIFAFGDAVFRGSTGSTPLNRPIVGMERTPSGNGYWLVASDGGIFAFGDAAFRGSTGGTPLNRPVVGMERTASGNGYWLVASDGGIFAFGDAAFQGSTGGTPLNQPIVGMARTPGGNGYWLVASDGGIFSFGDAAFQGSTGGIPLFRPIVGMAA